MNFNRIFCLFFLCIILFSCNQTKIIDVENRKTSDYLILMYISSDANNGDNFLPSIQQAENALTYIRNEDGSVKDGYNSVTVLALWDGPNYDTKEEYSVHGSPETKLLELGCGEHSELDNTGHYNINDKNDWCFSSDTIDLSSKAPWLFNNDRQEVNMGSYETLNKFLEFSSTYYKGEKTILTFCDHGSGPKLEIDIDLTDDDQPNTNQSRGIMFDDDKNGSNQRHLRTCDIGNALTNNGYTGENKVDLIIEDLCLGSSVEEAYGLQGMAKYFIASPKITYGNSIGYYHFITNLKKSKSLLTICREELDNFAQKWPHNNSTLTLLDLSETDQYKKIKTAVSEFGDLIATNYADSDLIKNRFVNNYYSTNDNLNDLGLICFELQDDEKYPLLNSKAKQICSLLESVIIRSFGGGCYYTDHENGNFNTALFDNNMAVKGLYLDGRCFGLTITTKTDTVVTVDGIYRNDIKWNQSSLFGTNNNWQKVIDLCAGNK